MYVQYDYVLVKDKIGKSVIWGGKSKYEIYGLVQNRREFIHSR